MAPLLELEKITRRFPLTAPDGTARMLRAVEDVSLALAAGETLGIVGESGCGKTTLARMILKLDAPSAGRIRLDGEDITAMPERRFRARRGALQAVFQDPFSSLDPRMRVGDIIAEPLHGREWTRERRRARVAEVMGVVGLAPELAARYPHAFSGGQRQRIGIARALAPSPRLIVCDEAVSALDVSIQSQVLNLLKDVQRAHGVAYVFISHNLAVIRHLSHRVAVMYLGRVVELAAEEQIFARPQHPYTRALMAAVPEADPTRRIVVPPLEGDLPSPLDEIAGCPFQSRCPVARDKCRVQAPALAEAERGHHVSCHYPGEIAPREREVMR